MGVLTAIQRFSLHDGPGIRSTVFFKGCNMRCAWCHNPETLSPAPQVLYYESKCVGCGACAAVCPSHTVQSLHAAVNFTQKGGTGISRAARTGLSRFQIYPAGF